MKPKYKKITLNVPTDLLEAAMHEGSGNLTQTVVRGLQLIAAKQAFEGLRKKKGEVVFSIDLHKRA